MSESRLYCFLLELMAGIEPATFSLRVRCSTIEPHQQALSFCCHIAAVSKTALKFYHYGEALSRKIRRFGGGRERLIRNVLKNAHLWRNDKNIAVSGGGNIGRNGRFYTLHRRSIIGRSSRFHHDCEAYGTESSRP